MTVGSLGRGAPTKTAGGVYKPMKAGSLTAFASNVAVALHPSLRLWESDQAIGKSATLSFQTKQALLDGWLVLELNLRGVEQSGNRFHHFSFCQAVTAAQNPLGLQQDQ